MIPTLLVFVGHGRAAVLCDAACGADAAWHNAHHLLVTYLAARPARSHQPVVTRGTGPSWGCCLDDAPPRPLTAI